MRWFEPKAHCQRWNIREESRTMAIADFRTRQWLISSTLYSGLPRQYVSFCFMFFCCFPWWRDQCLSSITKALLGLFDHEPRSLSNCSYLLRPIRSIEASCFEMKPSNKIVLYVCRLRYKHAGDVVRLVKRVTKTRTWGKCLFAPTTSLYISVYMTVYENGTILLYRYIFSKRVKVK